MCTIVITLSYFHYPFLHLVKKYRELRDRLFYDKMIPAFAVLFFVGIALLGVETPVVLDVVKGVVHQATLGISIEDIN
jgi:hypothetical protein